MFRCFLLPHTAGALGVPQKSSGPASRRAQRRLCLAACRSLGHRKGQGKAPLVGKRKPHLGAALRRPGRGASRKQVVGRAPLPAQDLDLGQGKAPQALARRL